MWSVEDLKMSKMRQRRLIENAAADFATLRELDDRCAAATREAEHIHAPIVEAAVAKHSAADQARFKEFQTLAAPFDAQLAENPSDEASISEKKNAIHDAIGQKHAEIIAAAAANLELVETARREAIAAAAGPLEKEIERLERKLRRAIDLAVGGSVYLPITCALTGLPILTTDEVVSYNDGWDGSEVIHEAIKKLAKLRRASCDTSDSHSGRAKKKTRSRQNPIGRIG